MSLSKEEIIALSNKYPIDLDACVVALKNAEATAAVFDTQNVIDECNNHLDEDFIQLLSKGLHLDIKRLPLSV